MEVLAGLSLLCACTQLGVVLDIFATHRLPALHQISQSHLKPTNVSDGVSRVGEHLHRKEGLWSKAVVVLNKVMLPLWSRRVSEGGMGGVYSGKTEIGLFVRGLWMMDIDMDNLRNYFGGDVMNYIVVSRWLCLSYLAMGVLLVLFGGTCLSGSVSSIWVLCLSEILSRKVTDTQPPPTVETVDAPVDWGFNRLLRHLHSSTRHLPVPACLHTRMLSAVGRDVVVVPAVPPTNQHCTTLGRSSSPQPCTGPISGDTIEVVARDKRMKRTVDGLMGVLLPWVFLVWFFAMVWPKLTTDLETSYLGVVVPDNNTSTATCEAPPPYFVRSPLHKDKSSADTNTRNGPCPCSSADVRPTRSAPCVWRGRSVEATNTISGCLLRSLCQRTWIATRGVCADRTRGAEGTEGGEHGRKTGRDVASCAASSVHQISSEGEDKAWLVLSRGGEEGDERTRKDGRDGDRGDPVCPLSDEAGEDCGMFLWLLSGVLWYGVRFVYLLLIKSSGTLIFVALIKSWPLPESDTGTILEGIGKRRCGVGRLLGGWNGGGVDGSQIRGTASRRMLLHLSSLLHRQSYRVTQGPSSAQGGYRNAGGGEPINDTLLHNHHTLDHNNTRLSQQCPSCQTSLLYSASGMGSRGNGEGSCWYEEGRIVRSACALELVVKVVVLFLYYQALQLSLHSNLQQRANGRVLSGSADVFGLIGYRSEELMTYNLIVFFIWDLVSALLFTASNNTSAHLPSHIMIPPRTSPQKSSHTPSTCASTSTPGVVEAQGEKNVGIVGGTVAKGSCSCGSRSAHLYRERRFVSWNIEYVRLFVDVFMVAVWGPLCGFWAVGGMTVFYLWRFGRVFDELLIGSIYRRPLVGGGYNDLWSRWDLIWRDLLNGLSLSLPILISLRTKYTPLPTNTLPPVSLSQQYPPQAIRGGEDVGRITDGGGIVCLEECVMCALVVVKLFLIYCKPLQKPSEDSLVQHVDALLQDKASCFVPLSQVTAEPSTSDVSPVSVTEWEDVEGWRLGHGRMDGHEGVEIVGDKLDLATDQFLFEQLQRGAATSIGSRRLEQPQSAMKEDVHAVNQFMGMWQFERDKSDLLEPLSKHLGVPWVVRRAVEQFVPVLEYSLEGDELTITTRLTMGVSKAVKLKLTGSAFSQADVDVGRWKSTTRVEGKCICTTQVNDELKATIYETRQITLAEGGIEMLWYKVQLQKDGIEDVVVNRYFRRIGGAEEGGVGQALDDKIGVVAVATEDLETGEGGLEEGEEKTGETTEGSTDHAEEGFDMRMELMGMTDEDIKFMHEYTEMGKEVCDLVMTYSDETVGWTVIQDKRVKVSRKDPPGDIPMIGRGEICLGKDFDMEEVIDFIWDADVKSEFDSQLLKGYQIKEYPSRLALLYQAFKGQWGVAGRDLVLYCMRKSFSENRTCVGCKSIEDWPDDDRMVPGLVRGYTYVAGYDIHRRESGDIHLTYVFQTDLRSAGIPQWITNRVKLDQLNVVKSIFDCLRKRHKDYVKKKEGG
eukprot:GHVQ01027317.1.p1 GENE.GHVQ01027317.1~~GHVQ01027317.1.p1  ORF type:complete len:1712 (+),score=223.84 GHVQ01027317.1:644-5137(+)